jgi:hypothetical protein
MNEKFYNLDIKETTKLMNKSQSFTTIPSIIVTILGGYVFDICGRRMTLYYMLLFAGASLVFFPIVAPN